MNHLIYPILLRNVPAELKSLLSDAGVPFCETQQDNSIHLIEIHGDHKKNKNETLNQTPRVVIRAGDLLENGVAWNALDQEACRPVLTLWREGGVKLTESLTCEQLANKILARLKQKIVGHGFPWARFSPFPAGYSGVFNIRVDLDEPEPGDWRRVLDLLEPIEPAVTWFLSTQAAERQPVIYNWLAGRDVQSHGHWHHVHDRDRGLNRLNLRQAHDSLVKSGFSPMGFASPCGRMSHDLSAHLAELRYNYLAGIGGLCGNLPRLLQDGIWRINALPVSEGLYLENEITNSDKVIEGYLNIARRAMANDRPLFWYGHAERRLGRKPEILKELLHEIQGMKKLWHVRLGEYLAWLEERRKVEINIRLNDGKLEFNMQSGDIEAAPELWIENERSRWRFVGESGSDYKNIEFNDSLAEPIIAPEEPEIEPVIEPFQLKTRVKQWLDWERETPVEMLQSGPMHRRVKGFLRKRSDLAWQSQFVPKAWELDEFNVQASA